jgi:glycosyltransferase involved in cell wall biosynthesis
MKRIERRILRGVDLIGVQSTVEMNYFETVLDKNRTGDVLVIKNGVGDSFFEDRLERKFDLLFVGTLDDNYRPTIHWFIREVYASFSEPRPTFALIGSLANEDDLRLFREFNIVYLGFVDDVGVCYRSSRILVAPVFKGFGTINKVLEGMAAGCVVIGDSTAFNGIENFVPGRDGLVATTAAEFAANIVSVLGNDVLADEIGARARNLMKEDFSWRSRLDLVLDHFCWFSQIPEVE